MKEVNVYKLDIVDNQSYMEHLPRRENIPDVLRDISQDKHDTIIYDDCVTRVFSCRELSPEFKPKAQYLLELPEIVRPSEAPSITELDGFKNSIYEEIARDVDSVCQDELEYSGSLEIIRAAFKATEGYVDKSHFNIIPISAVSQGLIDMHKVEPEDTEDLDLNMTCLMRPKKYYSTMDKVAENIDSILEKLN